MKFINAMTLRDGGTTCVSLEEENQVKHLTIDYSLPHDGRQRIVYLSDSKFSRNAEDALSPFSKQEKNYTSWLYAQVSEHFGADNVDDFLAGNNAIHPNGKWRYALNFLKIYHQERQSQ